MRVSSVSQHIWSLKLKREMARLWSVCWVLGFKSRSLSQAWSPHKSHVNTPVLFSFLPLCRSGYRSAVTFSCNKCFERKRPDIVLEIMRHIYECVYVDTHHSHTLELTVCSLTTNTPLLILFLNFQEDQDQPFLSLSLLISLAGWL